MNTRQDIEIKGKVYQIGFSFMAIRLWEEKTGKSIQESEGTWEDLLYVYFTLKAINAGFIYTLEEFVGILEEDPQLFIDLVFATQKENKEVKDSKEVKDLHVVKKKGQLLKVAGGLWMLSVLLLVAPVLMPVIFGLIWILGSLKALWRLIGRIGRRRS